MALKILTANASSHGRELTILRQTSQSPLEHAGRKHIITLLDDFEHHGPNGTHVCLVFEVMGPSAASMMDLLPENRPKKYGRRNRYPKWMARSMLRQALLGLDYLHQMEIVHGDFQPGNLLFAVSGLDAVDEARVLQGTGPGLVSEPVRRQDGKEDRWAPRYLALNQPLTDCLDIGPDFTVKISDLGGGELPGCLKFRPSISLVVLTRKKFSILGLEPTGANRHPGRSSRARTDSWRQGQHQSRRLEFRLSRF